MLERGELTKTFIHEYSNIDDKQQRRELLASNINRPPSFEEWQAMEILRVLKTGMTSGDIAKLTGLKPEKVRRMSEQGEIPAPVYKGGWAWWWDRAEIEAWWDQRQRSH